MKRLTITTRMNVTLSVLAGVDEGDVGVKQVLSVTTPSAVEVMVALDAGDQFAELDAAFEVGVPA